MDRAMGMILAGGAGKRLSLLVAERAKPAVPFGGAYRIIDFTLSNCVNSGIFNVTILTQFNPRSLAKHIGIGRPWDLDRSNTGIILAQPFLSQSTRDWYKGTADAVYQNLYVLEDKKIDEVIILSADHIYTMRYDRAILAHRRIGADVTVAVTEVPMEETSRFGVVTLDHNKRVVHFEEKPQKPQSRLISMGVYIFNKKVLIDCLTEDAKKDGSHDFGKDILPEIIGKYKVYGYRFRGYWRDIGTVESYWQTNMDLIVDLPDLNLYNLELEIRTLQENLPPVKTGPRAHISRSLISNGAIINGTIENSVISPRVFIEDGAVVRNSIIFNETTICKGAVVDRAIIDKQVWIGSDCHIGFGDDYSVNQEEPEHLNTGITLVGKGATIPANIKIGRNCKVDCWVEKNDFDSDFIQSGHTITRKIPRLHMI